jgi:hypothetical protein
MTSAEAVTFALAAAPIRRQDTCANELGANLENVGDPHCGQDRDARRYPDPDPVRSRPSTKIWIARYIRMLGTNKLATLVTLVRIASGPDV